MRFGASSFRLKECFTFMNFMSFMVGFSFRFSYRTPLSVLPIGTPAAK
jgi:hypothetical protein